MENFYIDDEIDLSEFFSSIYRNKKIIGFISILFLIFGFIFVSSKKKVWQGEFQIVLENNQKSQSSSLNLLSSNLSSIIDNGPNEIKTEITILESPSVLMNIFNYVKEQKISDISSNNLRFKTWKKNSINIGLEKGTNVLNVTYKDNNKDYVLPVLNKISDEYQNYSGQKKRRSIELSLNYLNEQLPIFREKSQNAILNLQKFSSENDLLFQNNMLISLGSLDTSQNAAFPEDYDIDLARIAAINQLRFLDKKLKKIQSIDENSDEVVFFASSLKNFPPKFLEKLETIKNELSASKNIYRDSDIKIKLLNSQKNFYIKELKYVTIDFLKSQKNITEAKLESTRRPPEILDQYRALVAKAIKEKLTLNKLEKEYRVILLEKAKYEDPWQLITKPTLLPNPVSQNKLLFSSISFLFGGFLSTLFCFLIEKKKGLIFGVNRLKNIADWPFLYLLPSNNNKIFFEYLELISNKYKLEKNSNLAIFQVGDFDELSTKEINKFKDEKLDIKNIISSKEISDIINYKNIVFLVHSGITKEQELIDAYSKFELTNNNLLGIICLKYNL